MKHLIKTLTILSLFSACGKVDPQVDEQPERKMKLPEYNKLPNGVALLTFDNQKKFEYVGSTLLWNENVNPYEVKEIVRTSNEAKILKAEIYKHYTTKLNPAREKKKKALIEIESVEKDAEIDQKNRESVFNQNQILELTNNSEVWFENQLKQINEKNPMLGIVKDDVLDKFQLYCELKLMQFASLEYFMNLRYHKRPTPSAICEPFYSAPRAVKGDKQVSPMAMLDTKTEECSDASDNEPNGKDYFACFWRQGVLKTSNWRLRYVQQESISDVNDIYAKLNLSIEELISNNKKEVLLKYNLFSPKIVPHYQETGITPLSKLKFITPSLPLRAVIEAYEDVKNVKKDDKNLFKGTYETDSPLVSEIRQIIRLQGRRDSLGVAVSDLLFNYFREVSKSIIGDDETIADSSQKNLKIGREELKREEIFGKYDSEVFKKLPIYEDKINSLKKEIPVFDEQVVNLERQLNVLENDKVLKNAIETLTAIHKPNTVHALWGNSKLLIEDIGNIYRVSYSFSSKLSPTVIPYVGCVSKTDGKSSKCPAYANLKKSIESIVTYDELSGGFELTAVLSDDKDTDLMIGIPEGKDDTEFNNLSVKALQFRQLKIKAFPALVSGVLPYMTGDIIISGGNQSEYRGSINLDSLVFMKKTF